MEESPLVSVLAELIRQHGGKAVRKALNVAVGQAQPRGVGRPEGASQEALERDRKALEAAYSYYSSGQANSLTGALEMAAMDLPRTTEIKGHAARLRARLQAQVYADTKLDRLRRLTRGTVPAWAAFGRMTADEREEMGRTLARTMERIIPDPMEFAATTHTTLLDFLRYRAPRLSHDGMVGEIQALLEIVDTQPDAEAAWGEFQAQRRRAS